MTTTEQTEDGRSMTRIEEITATAATLDLVQDQLRVERAVMAAIDPIHESYQEARIVALRRFETLLIRGLGCGKADAAGEYHDTPTT